MDTSSLLGTIAILLIFMIISVIGYENLPKRTQLALTKICHEITRLRREYPIINLEFVHESGKDQRQNAVLDWLIR